MNTPITNKQKTISILFFSLWVAFTVVIALHQGCSLNGAWHDQPLDEKNLSAHAELFQLNPEVPILATIQGNEIKVNQEIIYVLETKNKNWVDAVWDHRLGMGSNYCEQITAPHRESVSLRCFNEGILHLSLWVKYQDGGEDNFALEYLVKKQGNGDPPPTIDGKALYSTHCSSCHKPLSQSTKRGSTAIGIRNAISEVTSMTKLANLTSAEIEAIAQVLK